ncbi:AcrR family transcriptional regulator [Nakamurella sp. UYEF19]|uniref:TetR/AcrR family transcriptional regulator n=1 Tax=Nakamurella sp. UYEF19 TaxID=1756392 RepID=UPI0033909C37
MKARTGLTRERIVDTAIRLAGTEGLDSVSMRRIGKELGVEAMSLYYHLPSKAALFVLMADRSVAALPEPDREQPWDVRLLELLQSAYRAGVSNPAVMPVMASAVDQPQEVRRVSVDESAPTLLLVRKVESLLAESGLPDVGRSSARRGLIALVVGGIMLAVDGLLPGQLKEDSPADADHEIGNSLRAFIHGIKFTSS